MNLLRINVGEEEEKKLLTIEAWIEMTFWEFKRGRVKRTTKTNPFGSREKIIKRLPAFYRYLR